MLATRAPYATKYSTAATIYGSEVAPQLDSVIEVDTDFKACASGRLERCEVQDPIGEGWPGADFRFNRCAPQPTDRKQEILTYIAAILSTLAETDGSPASMLYLGVGMDMQKWETIRNVLRDCGWIAIDDSQFIRLTAAGRAKAAEVDAALATRRAG